MLPLALLLATAVAQAPAGWDPDEPRYDEPGSDRHLELGVWGGTALDLQPRGAAAPWVAADVGWRFAESALALQLEGHRYGADRSDRTWTPVVLARLEQRFATQRGLQGTFAFGLGAGRPRRSWELWLQVALGVRFEVGPVFLRAELGFERQSDLRLGAGAGLAF